MELFICYIIIVRVTLSISHSVHYILIINNFLILVSLNIFFTFLFVCELVFRIIAQGKAFFKKFWNIYDFILITTSSVNFIFIYATSFTTQAFISFANLVELLRILRVIKMIPYLKKLFTVLRVVLPQVANMAILLFTVVLIYGVIGVEFFAYIKPQSMVGGKNIHFRNPFISMMNLVRCLTGEMWFLQLADCSRKIQPNFVCNQISTFEDYKKFGMI